jgi:hypothetical protein
MGETPIYDALVIEQAGRDGREYVRTRLLTCPTCNAAVGEPCRTVTGKPTTWHKWRRWR